MPPRTPPRSPQLAFWLLAALLAALLAPLLAGCGGGGGGGGGGGSSSSSGSSRRHPSSMAAWSGTTLLSGRLYASEKHMAKAGAAEATARDWMGPGELIISISRTGAINGLWLAVDATPHLVTGTARTTAEPTIATLRGIDDGSVSGTVTLTPSAPGSKARFTARVEPGDGAWNWAGELDAGIRGVVPPDGTTFKVSRGTVQEGLRRPHDAWRPDELTLTKALGGGLLLQGQKSGHRITAALNPSDADGMYHATIHVGSTAVGSADSTMGPAIPGLGFFFVGRNDPYTMQFILLGAANGTRVWVGGETP